MECSIISWGRENPTLTLAWRKNSAIVDMNYKKEWAEWSGVWERPVNGNFVDQQIKD